MSEFIDHVVVFGFRGVGRRIVRQLLSAGQQVVVVDSDLDASEVEDLQRWGAVYLAGYGQSQDTLEVAGVRRARAVMCVTDDDVRNTRFALLTRDVAPDVRLVVRMANASVGRALAPVAVPGAVLDTASLASESFAEVVLGRTTHAIEVGDQTLVATTVTADRPGEVCELFPGLTPVAVEEIGRADRGDALLAGPAMPTRVQAGDRVTVLGRTDALVAVGVQVVHDEPGIRRPPLRRRVREGIAAVSDAVDRPFRIAFGVLVGLAALSIVILVIGYEEPDGTGMDALDALYFTAETIAAVGFGDFYFRDQDAWLRIWAVVLILLGIVLVTLSTALLTNALVTRRLAQSLGRQRVTGMADHIVVIGLGSVGSKVAADLRADGHEVAVIDGGRGERFLPQMRAAGIPVLFGDATLPDTQAAAGIHRAAGVAVLTSDDLVNIEIGLSVRGVMSDHPVPIALRVFSKNLARVIASGLDAGTPRSIAELASPWFVGAALGLDVLGTFYVGPRLFVAVRLPVSSGSGLDGIALSELAHRSEVVAVERDGLLAYPPDADTVFRSGDRAILVGQYDDLLDLLDRA